MNICIDIGNTLTKAAVFDGEEFIHSEVFSEFGMVVFEAISKKYNIHKAIISNVGNDNPTLNNQIGANLEKLLILDHQTRIPVTNEYKTPATLGKDRLAAVVGANFLYPGKNIFVIDAGSAITFDFINDKAEYKGGNIAPGLSMRFKALHQFTSRLPLLSQQDDNPLLGSDTNEAIVAGVQNSIIFETKAYIEQLGSIHNGLITVVTGGDSKFFDNKLKNTIFVIPNLVLIGLNRILNFNA